MTRESFDFAVIGTGPAGHYAAIQAAKLGKSVVVIEAGEMLGGVSVTMGTIPSKGLREATLHLSGVRERAFHGSNYQARGDLTLDDLRNRTGQIVSNVPAMAALP